MGRVLLSASVLLVAFYVACVNCKPWESKVGKSINYKVCEGKYLSKVAKVEVDPCTDEPCVLNRGSNYTISVTFKVNDGDINQTKAAVHGILAGVPIPFPIDNDNGCKSCGLTCPLVAGKTYKYSYTLPISSVYPAVDCVVEWELKNEAPSKKNGYVDEAPSKKNGYANPEVFCIQLPVSVE